MISASGSWSKPEPPITAQSARSSLIRGAPAQEQRFPASCATGPGNPPHTLEHTQLATPGPHSPPRLPPAAVAVFALKPPSLHPLRPLADNAPPARPG